MFWFLLALGIINLIGLLFLFIYFTFFWNQQIKAINETHKDLNVRLTLTEKKIKLYE